jgi:hypothetical protein
MTNPLPIPLTVHLRNLKQELQDAEWSGDDARSAMLRQQIERVRQRIASGEQWEVPF